MQIFRHIPNQQQAPCALAIGNFDGMHLGHQALLQTLNHFSQTHGLMPAVMTFEPHPREFFIPDQAPARLCSLREKLEYFFKAGIQRVYVCRFNADFANVTAADFMQRILRDALHANTIFVGEDFRFGANRTGTIETFKEARFNLETLSQVNLTGVRVSSTRVREALANGQLSEARQLLGRPYSISGKVVHGAKRGRQLGFPTANIHMRHERPALTGVYAVKLDGLNAVANLGVRPTIDGVPKLLLEVHVLDFNADLYGRHVHVAFLHKIRDEMKFDGLAALTAQITKDVEVAREYFAVAASPLDGQ